MSDANVIENYGGDYAKYLESLEVIGIHVAQSIIPEKDTIDAILLTFHEPRRNEAKSGNEFIDIVLSSGVHGVEGYLGSAIQLRYLHEILLQNEQLIETCQADHSINATEIESSKKGESPNYERKVLLIHAVNPNGMRHHRRTNENNVDLNRNALSPETWKEVRTRDPNFVGYVDIDAAINPFIPWEAAGLFSWVKAAIDAGYEGNITRLQLRDDEVKRHTEGGKNFFRKPFYDTSLRDFSFFEDVCSLLRRKWMLADIVLKVIYTVFTMGYTNGKRALVAAQYLKQSGIGYGGGAHEHHMNSWENSILALRHAINEFAGFQLEKNGGEQKVFWIDVHTGLGKYGNFKAMGFDFEAARDSTKEENWRSKLADLLRHSHLELGESSDDGVSEGYDVTKGFVNDFVLCPPPNCFSITQEFGTRPGVVVAFALILENKSHQIGSREFGSFSSWAFYPQRLSWRRETLRSGMKMLSSVLKL